MKISLKIMKLVFICLIPMLTIGCKLDYTKKESKLDYTNEKTKNENIQLNYTENQSMENILNKEVYLGNKNLKGLDIEQIRKILTDYSKKINIEPKNATFDKEKWSIEAEKNGKKLNIEKTIDLIFKSESGVKVEPIVEEVKPEITSESIRESIVEIGSFSTEILDGQKSRVNNIKVASDYINGVEIMPGEEFSFNGALGRRTKEKGYKKAPIIIKTKRGPKKGYGVGGGICQISTTLYNAALEAGLEITERHQHSKKVPYIEKGKDATVVYGGADLKFVNNRNNPIVINVNVSDGRVIVKLYEIKDSQLL